jgi:hypothetical protein
MDFRGAVERLSARITTEEIAASLGASTYSVKQARLHAGSSASRSPPSGWERALADLARERAGDLLALAEELER